VEKRLLNIKELAHYIGKRPQTIRNEIARGIFPIPHIKLRGALRFDIRDIDNYIEKNKRIEN
jgi:predicted DNA-binding transcriptional regulator AlpA